MLSSQLISLLALSCTSLLSVGEAQVDSFTFFDSANGSYQLYPAWIPSPQRVLRITFQTSRREGVLLYTEACTTNPPTENDPDYLLVRLEGGAVAIQLSLGGDRIRMGPGVVRHFAEDTLGENLNDNQPHTLTLFHSPDIFQFRYALDALEPVEVIYDTPPSTNPDPLFGPGGVYVGGVPDSSPWSGQEPFDEFFVGCVRDVLFGSGPIPSEGVASSTLEGVGAVGTVGTVQDGCLDPCSGVSCGAGRCVARWPDQGFCDCRGTMALGEECSEGEL